MKNVPVCHQEKEKGSMCPMLMAEGSQNIVGFSMKPCNEMAGNDYLMTTICLFQSSRGNKMFLEGSEHTNVSLSMNTYFCPKHWHKVGEKCYALPMMFTNGTDKKPESCEEVQEKIHVLYKHQMEDLQHDIQIYMDILKQLLII